VVRRIQNGWSASRRIHTALRSKELAIAALSVLGEGASNQYKDQYVVNACADNERAIAFTDFIQLRRRLLAARTNRLQILMDEVNQELNRPRSLFLTQWDWSLFDGAARAESNGFLDWADCPPWDTWIALVQATVTRARAKLGWRTDDYIVSWIPIWAEKLADDGCVVIPTNPCSWGGFTKKGFEKKEPGARWCN
jgi:hypothetical protein